MATNRPYRRYGASDAESSRVQAGADVKEAFLSRQPPMAEDVWREEFGPSVMKGGDVELNAVGGKARSAGSDAAAGSAARPTPSPIVLLGARPVSMPSVPSSTVRQSNGPESSLPIGIRKRSKGIKNWASYFSDGQRRVDYVLAYNVDDTVSEQDNDKLLENTIGYDALTTAEKRSTKRNQFESNLQKLGLELEHVSGKVCDKTLFTLVHAPFCVLARQAEHMAIKMPVVESDVKERTIIEGVFDKFMKRFTIFSFDDATNERLKEPNYFTAPFVAAKLECYVGSESPETFFDDSERSRMVYDLLIRTRYDGKEDEKSSIENANCRIGIERLVKNGVYTAAYPLHEQCEDMTYRPKTCSNRELLYWNWARITNFYKYQPLSLIKRYFGAKVGIYFAWLGYYTKVLFVGAIVGLLCFLYGLATFSNDIPSNDICGSDGIGAKVVMCPKCDRFCDYTRLNSSCIYAKLSYIFDNTGTVIFAALMSIGATLFLEGWKRYHSEIAWKWGLLDFEVDEETVRPEYQIRVKGMRVKRLNPITQQEEPVMPFRMRVIRFLGSGVTVLFFLLLVVAFVVGIVVYRILVHQVLNTVDNMKMYASLVTFSTASFLNLVVILAMSYVYDYIALKLTDWECPRTQTEFDNSYTFKVFLFQFINYYSSIFYIAFIKGNISSIPGRRILGLRPEECDPAGCMVELVIQLAIIMCGKQFWNEFVEIAYPVLMKGFRSWRYKFIETEGAKTERIASERRRRLTKSTDSRVARWERDYVLNPVYEQYLFEEYLEMVIQFGFVTLFVSAFPLAPLFALLNNILEIRTDAFKFTCTTRRPMAERAKDIGIWLPILDGISKAAVLVNAFIIAFTSDFIPKLVYLWVYEHRELYGYVNDSLSVFDVAPIQNDMFWSEFSQENVTVCRFRDYRRPPCTVSQVPGCDNGYGTTMQWWIVLAFRLAFVIIFEHIVSAVKAFVAYIIPDIPSRIFIQLQRQQYLARMARLSDLSTAAKQIHRTKSEDTDEVAFQPGLFEDDDTRVSEKLKKVIHKLQPGSNASSRTYLSCVDTDGDAEAGR